MDTQRLQVLNGKRSDSPGASKDQDSRVLPAVGQVLHQLQRGPSRTSDVGNTGGFRVRDVFRLPRHTPRRRGRVLGERALPVRSDYPVDLVAGAESLDGFARVHNDSAEIAAQGEGEGIGLPGE